MREGLTEVKNPTLSVQEVEREEDLLRRLLREARIELLRRDSQPDLR
jgi:hypothetical protein